MTFCQVDAHTTTEMYDLRTTIRLWKLTNLLKHERHSHCDVPINFFFQGCKEVRDCHRVSTSVRSTVASIGDDTISRLHRVSGLCRRQTIAALTRRLGKAQTLSGALIEPVPGLQNNPMTRPLTVSLVSLSVTQTTGKSQLTDYRQCKSYRVC